MRRILKTLLSSAFLVPALYAIPLLFINGVAEAVCICDVESWTCKPKGCYFNKLRKPPLAKDPINPRLINPELINPKPQSIIPPDQFKPKMK